MFVVTRMTRSKSGCINESLLKGNSCQRQKDGNECSSSENLEQAKECMLVYILCTYLLAVYFTDDSHNFIPTQGKMVVCSSFCCSSLII